MMMMVKAEDSMRQLRLHNWYPQPHVVGNCQVYIQDIGRNIERELCYENSMQELSSDNSDWRSRWNRKYHQKTTIYVLEQDLIEDLVTHLETAEHNLNKRRKVEPKCCWLQLQKNMSNWSIIWRQWSDMMWADVFKGYYPIGLLKEFKQIICQNTDTHSDHYLRNAYKWFYALEQARLIKLILSFILVEKLA